MRIPLSILLVSISLLGGPAGARAGLIPLPEIGYTMEMHALNAANASRPPGVDRLSLSDLGEQGQIFPEWKDALGHLDRMPLDFQEAVEREFQPYDPADPPFRLRPLADPVPYLREEAKGTSGNHLVHKALPAALERDYDWMKDANLGAAAVQDLQDFVDRAPYGAEQLQGPIDDFARRAEEATAQTLYPGLSGGDAAFMAGQGDVSASTEVAAPPPSGEGLGLSDQFGQ